MTPFSEPRTEAPQAAKAGDGAGGVRFYLPELDCLRFGAFLAVFVTHAFTDPEARYVAAGVPPVIAHYIPRLADTGRYGVDLFFLLSSFLITSLLVRERSTTGTIDLKGFWIRRCLRIWPLYFVFVGVVGFLLPACGRLVLPLDWQHATGLLTFTHNWVIVNHGFAPGNPTNVLWSVSLEEQFYVTWPILFLWLGAKRLRLFAIAMIAIAFLVRLWVIQAGADWYTLWFATPLRMEPIAVGALIALGRDAIPPFSTAVRMAMGLLGILLPLTCALPDWGSKWLNAVSFPLATAGCALVFLAVYGARSRFLTSKPLIYLGKISYGLYVFHLFVFEVLPPPIELKIPFAGSVFALLYTIALAALSYKLIEAPFLRLKDRLAHVKSRPT